MAEMSTNPNSPLEPPSATTTARTSIYGNPMLSSSSVSLELANGEVVELEKFAAKKIWIDDKIEFLSNLSPIDAFEPLPPARSVVSGEELAAWWREHDAIETEVHEFDYGDMAKMKALAMEASKHNLSREETDLIEVTLNNLFAVDKLLHLLRSRRKKLNLVDLRLKWEAQLADCASAHQKIVSSLPAFLSHARWTSSAPSPPPSFAADPSPPNSTADSLPTALATLHSHLARLTTTLIPASAATLDQLMDTARLPDAFLDEQDRVEDAAKQRSATLPRFLAGMVEQRKAADKVQRRALEGVKRPTEALRAEVDAALGEMPDSARAAAFAVSLAQLEATLAKASARLRHPESGMVVLPLPLHSLVPDQVAENARLLQTLTKAIARATSALDGARECVERYEQACQARAAADELLGEVERCSASLKKLVAELDGLGGQPDLASEACLEVMEEEKEYEAGVHRVRREAEGHLEAVTGLTGRVAEVAVALDRAGVPAQAKRALKEAVGQLDANSSELVTLLAQHKQQQDQLAALRAAAAAVDGLAHQLDGAEVALRRQLDAARWRNGQAEAVELDGVEVNPGLLRKSWQAVEEYTLRAAEAALTGAVSPAMVVINARGADVRARLDALAQLHTLLGHTRAQQASTAAFLDEAQGLSANVGKQQAQVDNTLSLPLDNDNLQARKAALAELTQSVDDAAAKLEELKAGAHARISFLAGRDAPGVSWDLAKQDASVRAAVNEATAAVGGQVDALRQALDRLAERITRPPTPPPIPSREVTPPATLVVIKTLLPDATLSPASAEAQLEQADHVEPLGLSLRRSHAHRRLSFDHLPAEDDVFGSSPAPPLVRTASQDDRVARLRAVAERLEGVEVDDWLDEEFLELPAEEEAGQIERELDGVEKELEGVNDGMGDTGLQADLGEVREELRRKRGVAGQVHELAAFRAKVEEADGALSDLLNAIDAASPDLAAHPDHSSDAGSRSPLPPMPLADALAVSRYSVEAARTTAVLLLGDSRVQSEVDRLEQALEEMVAMAEEADEQEREDRSGRGSPLSAWSRVSSRTSSLSHGASGSRPELVGRRASGRSASSSSAHSVAASEHSLRSSRSRMSVGGEGRVARPRLSGSQSSASLSQSLSRSGSVSHLPGLSRSSSSASLSRLPKSSTFVGGAGLARTASNASAASTASTSSTHSRSSRRSLSQSTSALLATPLARRFASASTASSAEVGRDTTPRRRSKASSGIPVATPRAPSRSAATPTVAQPFSFSTAQPRRALAQRSPNTPRVRKTSGSLSTPTAEDKRRLREKLETTPSRYMDSVRRSSATASEQRRRRSGSLSSPRVGKKQYKANPKRKVDVELGKVVNALPIAVEVKAAENEWHDQHGSYWINGRLYFCRILRSKTCMVRVGGGWTRLETFLVSKFGKAEGVTISPSLDRTKPPPLLASTNGLDRSLRRSSSGVHQPQESLWISSRDLRADLSASTSSALSPRQRDQFEPGAASSFLAASVGAGGSANGNARTRRISSSASTGGFSLLGASVGRSGGEAMRRSSSSMSVGGGPWGNDGGLGSGVGAGGPSGMRRGGSVGWGIGLGLPELRVGQGAERRRKSSTGRRVSGLISDGGLGAGAGGRVASPGGERVQAPWRI